MRIVIDEDTPNELTPLFRGPGIVVEHAVTTIGIAKGARHKPLSSTLKSRRGSKPS